MGVIQATDVARMRALQDFLVTQDFLTEDEADDQVQGGKQRDGCRENSERNRRKSHLLAGGFQISSFSG